MRFSQCDNRFIQYITVWQYYTIIIIIAILSVTVNLNIITAGGVSWLNKCFIITKKKKYDALQQNSIIHTYDNSQLPCRSTP